MPTMDSDPSPIRPLEYQIPQPVRDPWAAARMAVVFAMAGSALRFQNFDNLRNSVLDITYPGQPLWLYAAHAGFFLSWIAAALMLIGGVVALVTRGRRCILFAIGCVAACAADVCLLCLPLRTVIIDFLAEGLSVAVQNGREVTDVVRNTLLPLLAFFLVQQRKPKIRSRG
jgi:hypothetical protein